MSRAATLLQELERLRRNGYSESFLMVEVSANHSILCNEKLYIPHIDKNKPVTWTFTVASSSRVSQWCRLQRVFTLDPYLPEYSIVQVNASDQPGVPLRAGCQEWVNNTGHPIAAYQITFRFVSAHYGSFQQRIVFDFAEKPLVYRQLEVVVAPENDLLHTIQHPVVCEDDSELSWLRKYQVVPFDPTDTQVQRKSEFDLPPSLGTTLELGHFDHLEERLTRSMYKQRLHVLLHIEEFERRRQMTRLTIHCSDLHYCTQPCATDPSQVTIVLPVHEDLMDDATLLIRRTGHALVRLQQHGMPNPLLYEVVVESLKKNRVLLRASALLMERLRSKVSLPASVCFRFVDTYQFMHWALENVSLDVVFPAVPEGIREQWTNHSTCAKLLNESQTYALKQMLSPRSGPPLLILGPFGTGKTRTIAEAIKELISIQLKSSPQYRILLCTHSNSAADHYIKNHLHPYLTNANISALMFKPLRICWENRFVSTVSDTVLQYCLLDRRTGKFAMPDEDSLLKRGVVVTTLVTAASLANLNLPPGFFTHIFIDEAAQAMEVETIIPLCFAGPKTQVVLAGDHLQLNPPIMSPVSQRLGLGRSLLVRLYELYPSMSRWKVQLLQNYRAYDDIVDVPSHLFYQDTLVAKLKRPRELPYSIAFYGVHGQEEIADDPPSFLNRGEAAEVADRVEELINQWPTRFWEEADPARICVLSPYPTQVREIRRLLRAKSLGGVKVEGVTNVQGLEFDVLFISTVRTYDASSADDSSKKNMGFLSDCKLLNTAITRARFRLVIIGDPVALCSIGECRVCFKMILGRCNSNKTFHYRLPFEMVIKMTKDAKSERESKQVQRQGPTALSTPTRNNPSYIPVVNTVPDVPAPVFPRGPMPGNQRNVPFVQEGPPLGNYGPFTGRPSIFIRPQGPLYMQRQPVPLPMHPVPLVRNPPQQHPPIGFVPQVVLPQQMNLQHPSAPWGVPQQAVPQRPPLRVFLAQNGAEHIRSASRSSTPPSSFHLRDATPKVQKDQTLNQPSLTIEGPTMSLPSSLQISLHDRKEMLYKERDLLNKLKSSSTNSAVQENILRQINLIEKECKLLQNRESLHSALTSLMNGGESDSNHSDNGGRSVARPNLDDSDGIYPEDDYEDSETEEWFMAQQKDPIVLDYIKAFETLTSRTENDSEEGAISPPASIREGSSPVCSDSATTSIGEGQKAPPLQGWILQPSESTVYIENYSINEEHLEREEVQSKVALGELEACALQIDNHSDGNTAIAKVCDPDKPDIRINSRADVNRAFNGDVVAVEITNKDRDTGDPQGKVVAILKEIHPRKVVCRLDSQDRNVMTPINRYNSKFVILQSRDHQGQTGVAVFAMRGERINVTDFVTETEGKLFLVQLMKWGARYRFPLGFVVQYFNEGGDPRRCIPVLLAEHGVHKPHSKKIQSEVKKEFPPKWRIPETERSKRVQFEDVFSIDPASCVEVDDAMKVCRNHDGTYKVSVHIADVSFFVTKNSTLDKAALSHGASVYGSNEVSYYNPMLPSYVSKELCSLDPGEERLAVSVIFHLNEEGIEVARPEIQRSIVASCCKLSYDQCQDVLDGKKVDNIPEHVQKGVGILGRLSLKMWARRVRQGYVSLEHDVIKTGVLSSQKMVEEFMLWTNCAVAERLLQSPIAKTLVPVRRQLPPKTHLLREINDSCIEKGMEPRQYLGLQCISEPSGHEDHQSGDECVNISLKTWEKVSAALDEKDIGKVTIALIKHDSKAGVGKILSRLTSIRERSGYVVSSRLPPEKRRHFSLNVPSYTHFTSPIRRYMDIIVHRLLLAVLENHDMPYTEEELENICEMCHMMTSRIFMFENQLALVSRAEMIKRDSKWRLAKVDCLAPDYIQLGGDEVEHISPFNRCVRIHDCKPTSRDWLPEEEELVLSWKILEINATGQSVRTECNQDDVPDDSSSTQHEASSEVSRQLLEIPKELWFTFLQGFRSEDLHQMNQQRQMIDRDAKAVVRVEKKSSSFCRNKAPEEHIPMNSLGCHQDLSAHTNFYQRGNTIPVYLGAEIHRGLPRPSILAVRFTESIVCCLKHRRHPTKSFGVPQMVPTKATYSDAKEYQTVMLPLLQCEAVTSSVNSDSASQVILQNVSVQWNGKVGEFTLSKILCVARGLKLSTGDFLCLRCHALPCIVHCCVTQVDSRDEMDAITLELVDGFSTEDLNQTSWLCSIEVIEQGLSFRRMINAVKRLGEATELIRSVFLRRNIPKYLARVQMREGQKKEDTKTTLRLNPGQEEAVKNAVNSSFTLIQGPPGTGKTCTAAQVAYQLAALNRREGNGGQVLFCAPSNHAVDVAARILQKIPGLKVLRIYGKTIENQSFKQSLRTNLPSAQSVMDKDCEDISLHFRVRKQSNPHSSKLKAVEEEIKQLDGRILAKDKAKKQEKNTKDLCLKMQELYQVLNEAERHEIAETGTEVILCTCIEGGSSRVKRHARVSQVIIDEASMCLEPESLVTLSSAGQRLRQVVLLGDHKQLGAVIMSSVPRKLGLGRSLFDVLFNAPNASQSFSSCKLQTQYRMHPSIREFPSKHFYEDLLKDSSHLTTPEHVSNGLVPNFWPGGPNVRVVFCHVMGTEESPQDYTGPEGREESKRNPQEVNVVLRVLKYLMSHGIKSSRISVITPYSAQRAKISRELQSSFNSCDSEVLSVFASQGAEKDFVVLSTVRSLPVEKITGSSDNQQWLANHLGFLIDERQMNVALTRAKHGLVIIGNRHLLAVHNMWKNLVSHCQGLRCLVDEKSWQPAKDTS